MYFVVRQYNTICMLHLHTNYNVKPEDDCKLGTVMMAGTS